MGNNTFDTKEEHMKQSIHDLPLSFIKNIAIQLPKDYRFYNDMHKDGSQNHPDNAIKETKFIGRKSHIEKFTSFLKNSTKGVYLVTGYRGMGKTSFVNYVISKYKKENQDGKEIIPIRLTMAQINPTEYDILRQIVSHINSAFKPKNIKKLGGLIRLRTFLIFILVVTLISKYLLLNKFFYSPVLFKNPFSLIDLCILLSIVIFIIHSLIKHYASKSNAYNRLKLLSDRCQATVSHEFGTEDILGIGSLSTKIISKKTKNYPIADSKIIEFELNQFLDDAVKEGYQFVFIFDELDKIDATISHEVNEDLETFEFRNKTLKHTHRNRKDAIVTIIAGLKNFFTSAKAQFIFIAGREMFDASLSEISDKQSPLGSIFSYTFHIESLLKEETGYKGEKNISSLGTAIQEFLKYQLFNEDSYKLLNNTDNRTFAQIPFYELLPTYFASKKQHVDSNTNISVKKENNECLDTDNAFRQLYFLIQSLETYLIYRSSGSPKKLVRTFQEFISIIDNTNDTESICTFIKRNEFGDSENYLYFNQNNIYRLGYINNLYRPYLIQNGRSFKLYSENTIIGIPYIFDQLFKFHPFAFSLSNLEYIPELLNSGKTPTVRNDLKGVLNYLYSSTIRDTYIQLFDYKFRSKAVNEICFLSKVFEDEAAAFNFMLDESFPTKTALIVKIKELRSIFSKFDVDPQKINPQIFSIANFNYRLGDLYFFDQEYDDAINSYSDAIRPINNYFIDKMNYRDFVSLIQNKLKLGLCFEKVSSYEEALAFYSDAVNDIKRFLTFILKNGKFINKRFFSDEKIDNNYFLTSSMSDLLQICIQAVLANSYIQEKMGLEGITTTKSRMAFADLFNLVEKVFTYTGKNHLLVANGYLHYANLLYFKNVSIATPADNVYINENIFPDWYSDKIIKITKILTHNQKKNKFKREPLLALRVYFVGLDEVLWSRIFKKYDNNNSKFLEAYDLENPMPKKLFLKKYLDELKNIVFNNNSCSSEVFTSNHFKYFAVFLSSIGDCILSSSDMNNNSCKIQIEKIFKNDVTDNNIKFLEALKIDDQGEPFEIVHVLECYYLSAHFYKKYGRISSAIFQYRKIIHLLMLVSEEYRNDKHIQVETENKLADKIVKLIENKIFSKIEELHNRALQQTKYHMKNKVTADFKLAEVKNSEMTDYSIAGSSELKEIKLLFEQFKLNFLGYEGYIKYNQPDNKLNNCDEIIQKFINPYNNISSQFLRLSELDFYCKYLYKKTEKFLIKKETGPREKWLDFENYSKLENEIFNYVYSRITILRILKIYELDYMLGPSFIANIHYTLADVLNIKITDNKNIAQELERTKKEKFTQILGEGSKTTYDVKYHFEMAKDYFKKAIELHTGNSEYKNQINKMIYLEDDFNESSYHFGAALERYLLVNNHYDKRINRINKIIKP